MHLDALMLTKFGRWFSDCTAHHGGSRQRAGLGPAGGQDGLHQGLAVAARVWHHLLPHPHGQQQEGGEELAVGSASWRGGAGVLWALKGFQRCLSTSALWRGGAGVLWALKGFQRCLSTSALWRGGAGVLWALKGFQRCLSTSALWRGGAGVLALCVLSTSSWLWGWIGWSVGIEWLPELLSRDP